MKILEMLWNEMPDILIAGFVILGSATLLVLFLLFAIRSRPRVCVTCGHIDFCDVMKCDECGRDMP